MADEIIRIASITQLHEALGYRKPKHPLISVMDASRLNVPEEVIGRRMTANFYSVMLKNSDCGFQYGRNYYDFEEGVLTFTAPNQVVAVTKEPLWTTGWMLFFHPDLIRRSGLGKTIDQYSFFSYDVHEALHLSEQEEEILNDCIRKIEYEYEQSIDAHSQRLFVSNLELLLNYCHRFYERQFNTRTNHHRDVVGRVERLLREYYGSNMQQQAGPPTIQYLADQVNLSANYLGDLLKKETGKSTRDHINEFVIDRAKTLLLGSSDTISEIAYTLGFNYPHYFSRLFRQKTGMTPQKYREVESG